MSDGEAGVVIIITITFVPVFSLALPTVFLFAIAGVIAAAIIAIGVAVLAVVSWSGCLSLALRERDFGWTRDLILVPAVAAWAAVALSAAFTRWTEAFPHSDVITHLKTVIPQHGPIVIIPIILGPLAAYLWFRALAATPRLLARRDGARLFAYPTFALFAVWITAIVLTWNS